MHCSAPLLYREDVSTVAAARGDTAGGAPPETGGTAGVCGPGESPPEPPPEPPPGSRGAPWGARCQGLGFRVGVWGLGLRVKDVFSFFLLVLSVWGSGFKV